MSTEVHILLVDDDEIDVMAIQRAIKSHELNLPITVAKNGVEALDVLRGINGNALLPSPYVILLDMNMPRMNGIEFLAELRNDTRLAASVVFMLTTSSRDEDVEAAYHYNVAGFINKEQVGTKYSTLLEMLTSYCGLVIQPNIPPPSL